MHENITLKEIQDETTVLVHLLYHTYQRTPTCSKNIQDKGTFYTHPGILSHIKIKRY